MNSEALPTDEKVLLIVDDEPLMVDFFKQAMSKRGLKVFGSASGAEALALIESGEHGIELVVSDMSMPGMSGVELANRLMEIDPKLPILIATGHDTTTAQIGAPPNVIEVIRKPYQARALADRIREILG